MPNIRYEKYNPSTKSQRLIDLANEILEDFAEQGFQLTLRQLYYQMVARDKIPNNQKSYNNLGSIISKAREAGMIDWDHIEDRTRVVQAYPHWEGAEAFMKSVVPQYRHDLWLGQDTRCMVFVEKQALEQVVQQAAAPWDVPYFANKGYLSSSSIWDVARNMMLLHPDDCKRWVILHLGDHDPSGIDMSRDIEERLHRYALRTTDDGENGVLPIKKIDVRRIALNLDQVEERDLPPNPAKMTDSRFKAYEEQFGDESWELDALPPADLVELINDEIQEIVDLEKFDDRKYEQDAIREQLLEITEENF